MSIQYHQSRTPHGGGPSSTKPHTAHHIHRCQVRGAWRRFAGECGISMVAVGSTSHLSPRQRSDWQTGLWQRPNESIHYYAIYKRKYFKNVRV